MSINKGIELKIKDRVDIESKSAGKVYTTTEVKIPHDCVGVVSIRRRYGDMSIFNTSHILWGGFNGCPELHIANLSGTKVDLNKGEIIAHVAIVKTA